LSHPAARVFVRGNYPPLQAATGQCGGLRQAPLEPVKLRPGQVPSGRMTVEGRVVSVKLSESERWGSYYDMAVRLRNGAIVWSIVPRSLDEAVKMETEALRGRRVRFTATFEVTEQVPRFAFARRPRNASLI
jgi:hypothetical protein